jgi:hypothetical protein
MALNPPPFFENYLYICASTSEATLRNADKREALVRYSHGISMALKSINSDRAKLKEWADKWFEGLPPEIADVSFDINSKIFFTDPTPQLALFANAVDFINIVNKTMNADIIPASLTFDAQFDTAVAKEGVARG